jgi:hypothetical protein
MNKYIILNLNPATADLGCFQNTGKHHWTKKTMETTVLKPTRNDKGSHQHSNECHI